MTSNEQVVQVLGQIKDSGTGRPVIELGWLSQIRVNPPRIIVRLSLPDFAQSQRERIVNEIKALIEQFNDISDVQVELGDSPSVAPIGQAGHGSHSSGLQPIPGVKNVIAISSGKGGVGKTTVAVNLACALSQNGLNIGLLDADIYGPNTPIMLGVGDVTPEVSGTGPDQQIIPIEVHGIGMVSMGLLIDDHQPVIWRGPMLNGIIRQFLYQAQWGNKDFLVVDLPPGTGDAQLSLAQAVPMAGVVIVTTPQKVSLQDSRRSLAMFRQMDIPVLGVVENMTSFIPPDEPHKKYDLFGSGGGMQLAQESNVPLLAQIPMEMPMAQSGNEGKPLVQSSPDSISAFAFKELANVITNAANKITKF